jgi:hypothetical protein
VPNTPQPLISQPGIQRDGTLFAAQAYTDGQWCRFQRGLPRKMWGYQAVVTTQPEKIYGMNGYAVGGYDYLHCGSQSYLKQYVLNANKQLIQAYDRTPGSGFVISPNNDWQFDIYYDQTSGNSYIVAHAGQNLTDITQTVATNVWYGIVGGSGGTSALSDTTSPAVAGGVVALYPFLFTYDSAGLVNWCVPGNITQWGAANFASGAGQAYITGSKIVKGLPLRGSSTGPAGLFWSLDSLIRMTYTAASSGPGQWNFDTLSATSSVMSSRGIVEYDGIYFWAGVDRFFVFNGSMSELPNTYSKNWFFDNVNYAYRQKVFAFVDTRWGEIWWCYPRGMATECTHAVIYNVNEQYWYDTALPNSGRTSGEFIKVFANPIMAGAVADVNSNYKVWQHDVGLDEIDGQSVLPIDSWITTAEMALLRAQSAKAMNVVQVEPDFVQGGALSVQMISRPNARGPVLLGPQHTFPAVATTPDEQTLQFQEQGRLMRFKIESNTPGGDYQWGAPYVHVGPSDARTQS